MTINDPRDDPMYQVNAKGYKPAIDKSDPNADSKIVNKFHEKDDVDSSQTAHHHTLGVRHDQASSGDHTHNGKNSRKILAGTTINGSRSGGAALVSVIDALEKLGATDATTA